MNTVICAVALVAALAGGGAAAQAATANLVTNGGFETGDASGWSIGPDSQFTGINFFGHSGSYSYEIGGEDKILSQSLATVAGEFYNISFWIASLDVPANSFSMTFGGNTLVSVADVQPGPFRQHTFWNVAATTNSDALLFNITHYSFAFLLDDVSVSAVPVPAALPMLLAGLGGLGFVGRRSRKKSA